MNEQVVNETENLVSVKTLPVKEETKTSFVQTEEEIGGTEVKEA